MKENDGRDVRVGRSESGCAVPPGLGGGVGRSRRERRDRVNWESLKDTKI